LVESVRAAVLRMVRAAPQPTPFSTTSSRNRRPAAQFKKSLRAVQKRKWIAARPPTPEEAAAAAAAAGGPPIGSPLGRVAKKRSRGKARIGAPLYVYMPTVSSRQIVASLA
jgi:hypothetical protein